MPQVKTGLGRLIAVYSPSPAYIQRAVFITVLSFIFFLAMMAVYYIRHSIMYFILASAFLVLYLVTLLSFVTQRNSQLSIYENGLTYRKRTIRWNEITDVPETGVLRLSNGGRLAIPQNLADVDNAIETIARIRREHT
jgi:hypothetical protein